MSDDLKNIPKIEIDNWEKDISSINSSDKEIVLTKSFSSESQEQTSYIEIASNSAEAISDTIQIEWLFMGFFLFIIGSILAEKVFKR